MQPIHQEHELNRITSASEWEIVLVAVQRVIDEFEALFGDLIELPLAETATVCQ